MRNCCAQKCAQRQDVEHVQPGVGGTAVRSVLDGTVVGDGTRDIENLKR